MLHRHAAWACVGLTVLAAGCERPTWAASTARTVEPFDVREDEPKVLTLELELGGNGRPGDFRYDRSQLQLGLQLTDFIETCASAGECDAVVTQTWTLSDGGFADDGSLTRIAPGATGASSSSVLDPFLDCRRRDPCPQTLEALIEVDGPNVVEVFPSMSLAVLGYGRRPLLTTSDLILDAEVREAE